MTTFSTPLLALEQLGRKGDQSRSPADEQQEDPELEPKPLRCRACAERISDTSALFAMNAERVHRVFSNPYGLLLEILTVRWTEHVSVRGPATTEFTWYPGYAWEVAHCSRCQNHLGWHFGAVANAEPASFWGLLRRAIREED